MVGAQIVSDLATDGHDDGHDEVRKCRNDAHLDERERHVYCYATNCRSVVTGINLESRLSVALASVTLLISNPNTSSKYAGWLMSSR